MGCAFAVKPERRPVDMAIDELTLPPDKQHQLRWAPILAGLALVLLGLLDLLFVVWPLDLMNPGWEYLTTGKVSEHFWPVLLGVVLVLAPLGETPDPRTLGIRNGVRWGTLLFGMFLLLLLPLNLVSTIRIHRGYDKEYQAWAAQRVSHTDNAVEKLEQLHSRPEILQFVAPLRFSPDVLQDENPAELKASLAERIRALEKGSLEEARKNMRKKTKVLWRDGLKAAFSLLIGAVVMLGLWRLTRPYRDLMEFTTPEERRWGLFERFRRDRRP